MATTWSARATDHGYRGPLVEGPQGNRGRCAASSRVGPPPPLRSLGYAPPACAGSGGGGGGAPSVEASSSTGSTWASHGARARASPTSGELPGECSSRLVAHQKAGS